MVVNLNEELAGFYGTEQYHKLSPLHPFVVTDGIKAMCEIAQCYWLMDVAASYQEKLENEPFQVWGVKLTDDKKGYVYCNNGNRKELVRQELNYTDFPHDYEFYLIDGVTLLKSEY